MTDDDYDWEVDAYRSWLLAIAELRKRRLLTGQLEPANDNERDWLAEARRRLLESEEWKS
jgi:hypothetical protein